MSVKVPGGLAFWLIIMAAPLMLNTNSVLAEGACPVSCQCQSIPDAGWRAQCIEQERRLLANCGKGGADLSSSYQYCRMTGPDYVSGALLVDRVDITPIGKLEDALEQSQLLSWAVRENNSLAVVLQDQGDWRGALLKRKRESGVRKQVFQLALSLGSYFEERDQRTELNSLYTTLIERNVEDADLAVNEATEMKAELQSLEGDPNYAVRQALVQRILRNAGDSLAFAAEAARRNKDFELASELWGRSADLSARLVAWKEEGSSKPSVVTFYRQRAAARWYEAGLMALMGDDEDSANVAKQRSEALWIANQ